MRPFGEFSSGASDDIRKATDLAYSMICQWGMGHLSGSNINYDPSQGNLSPWSKSNLDKRTPLAQDTLGSLDWEVRDILDKQYRISQKIIWGAKDDLDNIANALLEKETLSGQEVRDLITTSWKSLPEIDDLELPD